MSTRKKKGLAMGFASRQKSTLDDSNQRLDSKLAELQKNQEVLEAERQKLEALREQLENRDPDISPVRLMALDVLHLSGDAQSRVFVNPSVVAEYTERMRFDEEANLVLDPEGKPWAPVRIYEDVDALQGAPRYWVADGFHRVSAAEQIGLTHFQCEVLPGSPRDAVRESLSANARHGLRRTREDKRRAVERALKDEEWRTWTDQRVADLCAVSRALASSIRGELERARAIPFEIALYGADGREFEREEPDLEALPEEAVPHAQKARKSATPKTSPRTSQHKPLTSVSWRDLDDALTKLEARTTLIAYPTSAAHYEQLLACLEEEDDIVRLICPAMSGSDWLWRGPALLDPLTLLGFSQPVLVSVEELGKQFIVWAMAEASIDAKTTRERLLDGGALLVGKVLDSWQG